MELSYEERDQKAPMALIRETAEDTYFRYIYEMGETPEVLEIYIQETYEYYDVEVGEVFTINEQRLLKNISEHSDIFDMGFEVFQQRIREVVTAFNTNIIASWDALIEDIERGTI